MCVSAAPGVWLAAAAPSITAQALRPAERSHCQTAVPTVTPSGSLRTAVSTVPSAGRVADSATAPASSTSVTVTVKVCVAVTDEPALADTVSS